MPNYTPTRMCMCCRQTHPKHELIRIVVQGDQVFIDKTQKMGGRGAYVCKNADCAKKFIKSKALNRAFKRQFDQSVYDMVLAEIENAE